MKTTKAVIALATVIFGLLATESAFAWHRARVGVGFYFGVPVTGYYPGYYYPPYYPYYPPTTVVVPAQPQTYIEQAPQAPQAAPPAQGYWYYCPDSKAYYPYVKDCPAGWQRVSPQPHG